MPDSEDWEVDAMSISWESLTAYSFPPFAMDQKVVHKASREESRLVLVMYLWIRRPWFPILRRTAHGPSVPLHLRNKDLLQPHSGIMHDKRDLLQPRSGIMHGDVEVLNLHTWLLCGRNCTEEDCQKAL